MPVSKLNGSALFLPSKTKQTKEADDAGAANSNESGEALKTVIPEIKTSEISTMSDSSTTSRMTQQIVSKAVIETATTTVIEPLQTTATAGDDQVEQQNAETTEGVVPQREQQFPSENARIDEEQKVLQISQSPRDLVTENQTIGDQNSDTTTIPTSQNGVDDDAHKASDVKESSVIKIYKSLILSKYNS